MTLSKINRHFKIHDPIIYDVLKDLDLDDWIKPHNKHNGLFYFQRLCQTIIGQQLSGKAAGTIHTRFEKIFKPNVAPKKLLDTPDGVLRETGLSFAKASYVKNIAKAYLEDTVKYDKFDELSDDEIIAELTAIKGVGSWTAEMFLIFTLHRENVFSYGDLGLKKGLIKLYNLTDPSNKQVENIISKWDPYKTYGSIALWHSVDNNN